MWSSSFCPDYNARTLCRAKRSSGWLRADSWLHCLVERSLQITDKRLRAGFKQLPTIDARNLAPSNARIALDYQLALGSLSCHLVSQLRDALIELISKTTATPNFESLPTNNIIAVPCRSSFAKTDTCTRLAAWNAANRDNNRKFQMTTTTTCGFVSLS